MILWRLANRKHRRLPVMILKSHWMILITSDHLPSPLSLLEGKVMILWRRENTGGYLSFLDQILGSWAWAQRTWLEPCDCGIHSGAVGGGGFRRGVLFLGVSQLLATYLEIHPNGAAELPQDVHPGVVEWPWGRTCGDPILGWMNIHLHLF